MKIATHTSRGKRKHNEDACSAFTMLLPGEMNLHLIGAVTADGMGGHEDGHLASAAAVRGAASWIYNCHTPEPEISRSMHLMHVAVGAVQGAQQSIMERKDDGVIHENAGTTINVVVCAEGLVVVAWLGDTETWLVSDGHPQRLTPPHRGTDTRTWPPRTGLTRHVDGRRRDEIDVLMLTVMPGDVLITVTDGISDVIEASEAERFVCESMEETCQSLVQTAIERGSKDNCTACAMRVTHDPSERWSAAYPLAIASLHFERAS